MVVVWIASVCSSERFIYLKEAIKSCLLLKSVEKVVLSIYCTFDLSEIEDLPRLIIKKRSDPLKQFGHLALLVEEQKYSDDQWVTFCDDDDLLLPDIEDHYLNESDCFIGSQWITANRFTNEPIPDAAARATVDNVFEVISRYKEVLLNDTDFTGTSARYYLIKRYFEHRIPERVILPLEDVGFMKFLTDHGAQVIDEPFVFRRFFGTNSIWRNDVIDLLNNLIGRLDQYLTK